MTFLVIFSTSFLFIVFLVIFKVRRLGQSGALQSHEEWYSIDLVTLKNKTYHHVRLSTRPIARGFLYSFLAWYRNRVQTIRNFIRRLINRLLHHLDEKHDHMPPQQSSRFLNHIKAHKDTLHEDGRQELHDDFPDEEA